MSLYNSIMGNTVGLAWSALTGTVDKWTKQNQIDAESAALVQASGNALSASDAQTQSTSDVTQALIAENADPSQAASGFSGSLFKAIAIFGLIAVVVIAGAAFFPRR